MIVEALLENNTFDAQAVLSSQQHQTQHIQRGADFNTACARLETYLDSLQTTLGEAEYQRRQTDAIRGETSAVSSFMKEIETFMNENPEYLHMSYPDYYVSRAEALFQETLGMGPMSVWLKHPTEAAKVTGTSILFRVNGQYVLQPFKYRTVQHVNKLIRSITLGHPEVKINAHNPSGEVDMIDRTRVTILTPPLVDEPTLIFRQYPFSEYTFDHEAVTGAIGEESVELHKALSRIMMNMIVTGPPNTGKTTFLRVIYGARKAMHHVVTLEADSYEFHIKYYFPERAPWIIAMKTSLATLTTIFRRVLRLDPRYGILPEARSAEELELLLLIAERGRGFLATYHSPNIIDIPAEFARHILEGYPNRSYYAEYLRVSRNLDIVISIDETDNGRKLVRGVYAFGFDDNSKELHVRSLCRYIPETDSWVYSAELPPGFRDRGIQRSSLDEYSQFERILSALAKNHPDTNPHHTVNRLEGLR